MSRGDLLRMAVASAVCCWSVWAEIHLRVAAAAVDV